jgi:hypothetical protein
MDPSLITKIAAAGSMGVSIYCIMKVYKLLEIEQSKEKSRKFKFSIYVSMIFAIFMTVLSLGIEYVRYKMNEPITQLKKEITKISQEQYYSVDQYGNPKEINITLDDQHYGLTQAFPKSMFKVNELKLRKGEEERFFAIMENIDGEIVFGYLSNTEIKSKADTLFVDLNNKALNAEQLWVLGLSYTPSNTMEPFQFNISRNKSLTNTYLIKLLSLDDSDNNSLKENAIKLLTQQDLMNKLDQTQYKVLIKALQSGIRETPWGLYELAQVYLSRSWQSWQNPIEKKEDQEQYEKLLNDYTRYYEKYKWIKDIEKYPLAHSWYLESIEKLKFPN